MGGLKISLRKTVVGGKCALLSALLVTGMLISSHVSRDV